MPRHAALGAWRGLGGAAAQRGSSNVALGAQRLSGGKAEHVPPSLGPRCKNI